MFLSSLVITPLTWGAAALRGIGAKRMRRAARDPHGGAHTRGARALETAGSAVPMNKPHRLRPLEENTDTGGHKQILRDCAES